MKKVLTIRLDRKTLSLLKVEAEYRDLTPEEFAGKIVADYIERLEEGPSDRSRVIDTA